MRFIFILLFLISFSSVSIGGVGDIYFCNMEHAVSLGHKGYEIIAKEKFQFKYDEKIVDFGTGTSPFGTRFLEVSGYRRRHFIHGTGYEGLATFLFLEQTNRVKGSIIGRVGIISWVGSCSNF